MSGMDSAIADTGLVDVAAGNAAVSTGDVAVNTGSDSGADAGEVNEVETAEVDGGSGEGSDESGLNADGTEKTPEQKAEAKAKAATDAKTPQEVRKALKAFRDADPKNAAMTKILHGSYERYQEVSKMFPGGVSELRNVKQTLDTLGGLDAVQETLSSVQETDAALYEGNGKLLMSSIVDDLKAEGKLDSLAKIAPNFLDSLREHGGTGYYEAIRPHFISALQEVNMHGAINGLVTAFGKDDKAAMREILSGISSWYNNLLETDRKAGQVSPEKAAFLKEKEQFETGKRTDFQNTVAKECETYNNKSLGTALKAYLKTPFFKGFPRETLMDLGNGIKARLFENLKADKTYQTQMKAMWGAKTPDKSKITAYHNAKLDSIAERIVRETVQQRYPGYAKGGAAAGRVAAAEAKKAATNRAVAGGAGSSPQTAIFVATKPKWEAIDFDADQKQLNYIAGRAKLRGSGRWVTWRKQ